MRISFVLLALFFSQLTASAGEYAVFRAGSHTRVDCCVTNSPQPVNGDIWIPFTPTNSDRVIQHYDYSGSSLVYSYVPPPPPIMRNLAGFVMAIRTEPTFNAQIRNNMGKLIGLLAADYTVPQLAQQDWADAVGNSDNATWLTSYVQSVVTAYAATYNIPIAAGSK